MSRFDRDQFVADCLAAAPDQAAVREVVERAVSDPDAVEAALSRKLGTDLGILHYSDELTIQHVVFPPKYRTGIHDHLTWAVIGTWGGYEDQHAYRRDDGRLIEDSGARCGVGDVITLAGEAIHEVFAPPTYPSAALHVYGGPLFDKPRHEWTGTPPTERPIDDASVLDRYLEELTAAGLAC
jgi:predicted metal-dependent enzyme (double-stranded beta helix superfamily)